MALPMKCWSFVIILVSCVTSYGQLLPPEQLPIAVDGFAAIVNERIITASEVLTLIERPRQEIIRTERDPKLRQEKLESLFDDGLQSLIDRALMLEAFAEQEIEIPETAIEDRIGQVINRRFNDDRSEFENALVQDGITFAEWRRQISDNIALQELKRQEIYSRLAVLPRQIRALYAERTKDAEIEAEVRVRAIAMKRPENREERTTILRKLYEAQLQVKDGSEFGSLAKAISEGPNARNGGDFGWTKIASLKPELQEAIRSLKVGEISNVVRADDYYYLLKVEGVKDGRPRALVEMQSELEGELMIIEEKRLYDAWMMRLNKKYYVKRF